MHNVQYGTVQWHGWTKAKEEKADRTVRYTSLTNLADIADMHGGAESFHNFCRVEQQAHVRLIGEKSFK